MTSPALIPDATETDAALLAQRIALKVRPGDAIALSGDLGSGKTTFARALIRALMDDPEAEVPSPTFSLLQTYATQRLPLAHLDLYRLKDASEAEELGVADFLDTGAIIVEWPEHAPAILPPDRLDIALAEGAKPDTRRIAVTPHGSWTGRWQRLTEIASFLTTAPGWSAAGVGYLQGDASARAYARVTAGHRGAVLMDAPRLPDGPPIRNGLPYSRIAHLAEDVTPFVAVSGALSAAGLSVPELFAIDLDRGLLLLEDLGDRIFAREIANGASQTELWSAATDVLAALHRHPVPAALNLPSGASYEIPRQDRGVLAIETELLVDWYWPALYGTPIPADARAEFLHGWNEVFGRLVTLPAGWVLRDYHSPNLTWLPDRQGIRRVGLLDFQDALQGPSAYDLVSLLQDARVDVPASIETVMFGRYCQTAMADQRGFDRDAFEFAYSALGAQRNTKILGIFARLARRDGKTAYLRHIPRLWGYLERDLSHPELKPLRVWYDRHFPLTERVRSIAA